MIDDLNRADGNITSGALFFYNNRITCYVCCRYNSCKRRTELQHLVLFFLKKKKKKNHSIYPRGGREYYVRLAMAGADLA